MIPHRVPDILLSSPSHDLIILVWDRPHKAMDWLCNAKRNPLWCAMRHRGASFALLSFKTIPPRKTALDVLVYDSASGLDVSPTFLSEIVQQRRVLFGAAASQKTLFLSLYGPEHVLVPPEVYTAVDSAHVMRELLVHEPFFQTLLQETRPDAQANLILAADYDMEADFVMPTPLPSLFVDPSEDEDEEDEDEF